MTSMFDDLKDWPGARRPVNRSAPSPIPAGKDHWADKPSMYPFGVDSEGEPNILPFYTIRHLSMALGVQPVTIRAWESKGLLPRSGLRSAKPSRAPLGHQPKGRRLWTKEMIDAILRIAQQEGVVLNGRTPTESFARRIDPILAEIHTQFLTQYQTK